MQYVIAAFYHFFEFPHFAEMQAPLLGEMKRLEIKGSVLVAPEGVNSTIAGTRENIDSFLSYLKTEIIRGELEHKESLCERQPFGRAKVRLKKETISLGERAPLDKIGEYISPQEWNALMEDPDTILLDTRNDYEVHLGTFEGAVNPGIRTFKELPAFVREKLAGNKQAKIATFCTGGIRCEKFTAWLAEEGFENVYHLKGGILKYLEEIPQAQSKWQGECYVFDERIAVGHGLAPSETAGRCQACGYSLTREERADSRHVEGVKCPHCEDSTNEQLHINATFKV